MGLDLVELVMETEEVFGIEIPDEECAKMFCPRDMIDHIFSRIGRPDGKTPALKFRAFSRFRNACLKAGFGSRKRIKPSTELVELFPRKRRRRGWQRVEDSYLPPKTHWPSLQRPTALKVAILILSLGGAVFLPRWMLPNSDKIFFFIPTIPIGISVVFTALTRSLRSEFPLISKPLATWSISSPTLTRSCSLAGTTRSLGSTSRIK